MDSTVLGAAIAAIAAVFGTLLNFIISFANITSQRRIQYATYIIHYREACLELIRLSIHLRKALDTVDNQYDIGNFKGDYIFHRNEAFSRTSKLHLKGVILFPCKKPIIDSIFNISTQGFAKKINIQTFPLSDNRRKQLLDLSRKFPEYSSKVYEQLEKSVSIYSLTVYRIKSFFKHFFERKR